MDGNVATLVEMGFGENAAKRAMARSPNIDSAMDWLLQHANDPDLNEPFEAPSSSSQGSSAEGGDQVARSFKCEDCGKILRDSAAIELHAHRTGHENFAESTDEIKPLSEEEKKAQLAKLKEILKEKRKQREVVEEKQTFSQERERRKAGREGREAQVKFKEQQRLKELEKQKREKEEEKRYKEEVKRKLEQDKLEKQAKKQAAMQAQNQNSPSSSSPSSSSSSSGEKKEYHEARIQVRLPNNSSLTHTFPADAPLADVITFVSQSYQGQFFLMTTFPRKVYGPDDVSKTLKELQLVPSCAFVLKTE